MTSTAVKIKGLSIDQPYASLIVLGVKTIENRTWKPPQEWIGNYVAIHATQKFDYIGAFQINNDFDIHCPADACPRGAIIGVARLTDVLEQSEDPWFKGPYGWVLEDITPIQPIHCSGQRKLWELSPAQLALVREGYKNPLSVVREWDNESECQLSLA